MLMSALEDDETQRKGVVCVVYNIEPRSALANDPRIYLNVYQLLPNLPFKMMGAHYCVQDAHLRLFMSSIRVAMSREVRLRSRVHHGSHEECLYTLMTFGVPRKCFPISHSGELLVEKHNEFVTMRRHQEELEANRMMVAANNNNKNNNATRNTLEIIVIPKNVDVLLGRGRPFQEHAGNVKCNYIVVSTMDEYEEASRNDKTTIARNVINRIKGYGGRFLKLLDGVWTEVDDTEALRKISHSFRTHRQLIKTQQQEQEKEKQQEQQQQNSTGGDDNDNNSNDNNKLDTGMDHKRHREE
jgi:hypothetical protein